MLFTSLSLDSAENRIINFWVGEEAQKVLLGTPALGYIRCGFQSAAEWGVHADHNPCDFACAQEWMLQTPACLSPDPICSWKWEPFLEWKTFTIHVN